MSFPKASDSAARAGRRVLEALDQSYSERVPDIEVGAVSGPQSSA